MKNLYCASILAMTVSLLNGCGRFDNGSPALPPADFTATAGDNRVILDWTALGGVDYWLFTSTSVNLTAFNWTGLPNAHAFVTAISPFYYCRLLDGTPYYFATNGRINGGPGGPSSPTITATPYNAASGVPWTTGSTPSTPDILGVGYASLTTCSNTTAVSASGSFVAVGTGGAIFTSTDGKNWAVPASPPSGFSTDLYAVAGHAINQNYPANPVLRWVAVGDGGASVYSTDGINWFVGNDFNSNPADPNNYALRSITYVPGNIYIPTVFFAVGDHGTILSSSDGKTWTAQTSGTTNNLNGVTHGLSYVAVGDSGTILTSINGSAWVTNTAITPATTSNLRKVAYYGGIIVAVGDAGTIVTSINAGSTWTSQVLPGTPDLVGIAAEFQLVANPPVDPKLGVVSTAQFVAVDSAGNAYTSVNGLDWSSPVPTSATSLKALVSSGFGYVAVGASGVSEYAF